MRSWSKNRTQRGAALLLAIFALMLLAALGLAMLSAADLETGVAANYRDKETAIYAAMSGLQEARDRLIPIRTDPALAANPDPDGILPPADLPSLTAPNVIYIINPSPGETVAPWLPIVDGRPNPYFDTELCHESILGLSGTPGVPCGPSDIPSGTAWFRVVDNSDASYNGFYKLNPPLAHKWTRITLKTANMNPNVWATGSSTDNTQMCWDGKNQIPRPAGHGPDCGPDGSISLYNGSILCGVGVSCPVPLANQGAGYTAPTVTIAPPPAGGRQATATANVEVVADDKIGSITLVDGGHDYSWSNPPTVVFSGGGGSGAAATAIVGKGGREVQSVTATNTTAGCYASPSTQFGPISGGGGYGATISTTLTGQTCMAAWTVAQNLQGDCESLAGTGQGNPVSGVTISGGGGSGFSGTITLKKVGKTVSIQSYKIDSPGTGYTSFGNLAVQIGGSCTVNATFTPGYQLDHIDVTNGGTGYTSDPIVTVPTPDAGTPPIVNAHRGISDKPDAGKIIGITLTNPGSGYTSAPSVSFVDPLGLGSGAAAVASLGSVGKITSVTLTDAGKGYVVPPAVTFSDSPAPTAPATIKTKLGNATYFGQVMVLTSLAVTQSGARSMLQAEVATGLRGAYVPGALTIDGPNDPSDPNPLWLSPSSSGFYIKGSDLAGSAPQPAGNSNPAPPGCDSSPIPPKPAIGVYDNPNAPTSPTAEDYLRDHLSRETNYPGRLPSPDVENVYDSLGSYTTPQGVEALASQIAQNATQVCTTGNSCTSEGSTTTHPINLGSPDNPFQVTEVKGDLTLSGSNTGYGILLVRGSLYMDGNFSWYGPIFVIGNGGLFQANGGGNGVIVGSVFVAQSRDSAGNLLDTLAKPQVDWSGGGGNGIYYDHCWVDDLLAAIHVVPPPSNKPLKILSVHALPY
ncbi:MAG: hypothetical protein ACE14L_03995 [Terriglobales bacterium]